MPTTYRTKDGIVLRNVPDGTPEDEIKARIADIRAGMAAPQSKGPSRRGAVQPPFAGEKMPMEQLSDFGGKIKRGGELAMRGINNVGMGLLTIVPDAGVAARNLLTGNNYQLPSDMFKQWQDARVQAPTSFGESAFESGVNIAAGAAIPFGPAKQGVKAVIPKGAEKGFSGVMQAPVLNSAQRAAQRAVREQAGDETTRAILAERLRNYRPGVEGVKPTVAEAVKGLPEGSPLQSLQQQVAQIGGQKFGQPSVEFGRQLSGNQVAREAAEKTLGATHGARREAILANANSLSQRLRNLRDIVARKSQQGDDLLRETGKAQTDEAMAASRLAGRQPPATPMLDRARALRAPDRPTSTDAYLRPSPRTAPAVGVADDYAAQAAKSRGAASDIAWEADKANLERAGAELEKDLLENTGLKDLVPEAILSRVKGAKANPRVYASEISRRTYKQFVDDIEAITQPDGTIDAAALDQVRKEFGPKLAALFGKDGWDTKDAAFVRAMRSAQNFIDDAIETAGGTGYKNELARYSEGTKRIEADKLLATEMYDTLQPTSSSLQTLIDDQVHKNVGGSLLNPKLAALNLALRLKGNYVGPSAIGEIGKLMRSPEDLAFVLGQDGVQSSTEALQRALMQYARRAPGAVGGSRE